MTGAALSLGVLAQTGSHQFWGTVVNGLSLGAIYALLAMGFVIIFKATQVVNFAHGAMATLGAYFTAVVAVDLNFPGRYLQVSPLSGWLISVLVALVMSALVGMLLERLFVRPMVGEELFSLAIVTLGMHIILLTVVTDLIGPDPRSMADPWGDSRVDLGSLIIPETEIAQFVAAVALMALVGLFFRTRTGVAMRATAFDQEAARAQGINVGRIFAIAWAIGAVLATVGGIFGSVYPRRVGGFPDTALLAMRAFPAIILGGLDSVGGAVLGGMIVGLAEAAAGSYLNQPLFGTGFSGIVPYLLMMCVLFVRPYGLFGTGEVRRV
ncbi:MAG: branched-chain amino acid ABC transporter permease [bacterium]|nr:branched-chain amino acid ABC transporter permease [bacterium]